jgi:phosphohistidine phosphatase
MTKTLYLLRHAEAPMAYGMTDKDRPLSPHGMNQAKLIAKNLVQIDHVLCSNAVRTKMTSEALVEAGAQFGKIDYLDHLYNATAGTLLENIQSTKADNILIIAHNPGIHMLANMLADEDDANPKREKLHLFYNPATLSILECDIKKWSDIQPRENKLADLIIPD